MRYGNMYGSDNGRGFGPRRPSFAPVRVGEEIDVSIEAVGEKGDGIAKKKGFVLFVPNTKAGDNVKIRITKVLRKVGFAEVIGTLDAPPKRDDDQPPRPHQEQKQESQEYEEPQQEPEAPSDSEDFGEEDEPV